VRIAILAYGSLISDPGAPLGDLIVERRGSRTPFRVEYSRKSRSRADAPVLVPVERGGGCVDAKLLVLRDGVTPDDVKNELYWRETHLRDVGRLYRDPAEDDPELCRIVEHAPGEVEGADGLDLVLTTRFGVNLADLRAEFLAKLAIASVQTAKPGKDGISYLRDNIRSGIETPLTEGYRAAVLSSLGASSLEDALLRARSEREPAAGSGASL